MSYYSREAWDLGVDACFMKALVIDSLIWPLEIERMLDFALFCVTVLVLLTGFLMFILHRIHCLSSHAPTRLP